MSNHGTPKITLIPRIYLVVNWILHTPLRADCVHKGTLVSPWRRLSFVVHFEPCCSSNRSIEDRMALDLFPANMAESVQGRLLFAIPKKGSFVRVVSEISNTDAPSTVVALILCLCRKTI